MNIDRDQLIKRVAEKHKLILSDDDPLLASVFMHDVVFEIHTAMLIQKMDEQNTRIISTLQTILNNSRSEAKKEQIKFAEAMQAIHKNNLGEYRQIITEHITVTNLNAAEAMHSKNSSWLALVMMLTFGILYVGANLYIIMRTP